MGKCNHKQVCQKCVLRIRLIMDDKKCSICKTEMEEIIISNDHTLTWNDFEPSDFIADKEDPNIYY